MPVWESPEFQLRMALIPDCRQGVVPCKEKGCSRSTQLGANATQAIEEVIAKARHLANGGIDLVSPGALECSPKLRE